MPDITMCVDDECLLKDTCYRYNAIPNVLRQSYFAGIVRNKEDGTCPYYMGNGTCPYYIPEVT